MTELTERQALRETQVAQVFLLMFEDPKLTQKEACERIGIPTSTFRRWVSQGNDSIEKIRDLILASQMQILFSTTMARVGLIEELIDRAKEDSTETKDVLAITRYLGQVAEEMTNIHNAKPGVEADAHAFLKQGPQTQTQKSKIASLEVRSTDDGFNIDLIKEQDIIDADYD